MCVTNTVRRRAVAKLPAHALGGGSIAKAAPYTTSSSALTKVPAAAAQVRRQQEEAQQLLLRRKAIVASSSAARGGHAAAAAFAAAATTGKGKGRAKSKKEEKEKEKASHDETAAVKSGKVSPPTAPPSSSTEVQQPATGCEKAAPKPSPPPSSSGAGKGTTDSSSSPYEHGTVTHSYHDHAADADTKARGVTRGGVTHPFPLKLHGMLDVAIERDGLGHVVSWQPHGRAFLVHNTKMFVDVVMPKYFKQTKMASFQRQLNLYGFQRITAGMDRGAYYHELFLRGMPFLAAKMQRTRVKGTGVRMASSPETEPNFYAMKPVNAHKIAGGGVLGSQGLGLCLGHHDGATAAQVEAATVAAKAAAAQLSSLQRRQQHCDGGPPTSPPRHPPPLQIAPSPNLGAAVMSAVSGSTLQSLLINPLAAAQQSSQKASLKEALSVISPVPPHHPALLPAVVGREGNNGSVAAAMTAAAGGTVVTPCSAHHKPGRSLKDLQKDSNHLVVATTPTDAALKAVVPPPPLALPGKALKSQEQRPSPPAPQRGIELEHFIHRPRPPPLRNLEEDNKPQEEDRPQEENQERDSKSNDRTFERSVLQYLDSMQDDDDDDNKDFKDAAARRTIVDVVEDLASMEPLPFRPVQGPSSRGGGIRLQPYPDKMDLPRRDFVPPTSPIRGSSNARRHSDDASSTSSSSSCSSPAAAVHPEPSEKSPEKKRDDVEDVLKHHGRFDDLDIDIGGMEDQYQVQDQDRDDVLVDEDEDDDVASIPKHLLSPKSKEAEMDRFLEELFQKSSCGGGGKMFLDPLDPDDGMRLDDEALGYLLDEVVAGE